jgi:hypothetical protein
MPSPKLYCFSTPSGRHAPGNSSRSGTLADKLKMHVVDLMRQCNAKIPPTRALVKGLAKELD